MHIEYRCLQSQERALDPRVPGAGDMVILGCHVGTGNQTWVLLKEQGALSMVKPAFQPGDVLTGAV